MEEILDFDKQEGSENQKPHLETLGQGYHLEIGSAFSRGWEIFAKYPWGFMGYAVIGAILSGMSIIVLLIPVPALLAGVDIVAGKIARNEQYEFSDFFGGFQKFGAFAGIWAICFVGYLILMGIMIVAGLFPLADYMSIFEDFEGVSSIERLDALSEQQGFFTIYNLVSTLISFTFTTLTMFVFPLIAVSNLSLMNGIKWSFKISAKKFIVLFAITIVSYILTHMGAFACGIGIIFTAPLAMLLKFGAYDEIFGSHSRENEV